MREIDSWVDELVCSKIERLTAIYLQLSRELPFLQKGLANSST